MTARTTRNRTRQYRARLRKAGLRPLQIWVPDTRAPAFAAECRRQARLLRADPAEAEILEWIEQVADTGDDAKSR